MTQKISVKLSSRAIFFFGGETEWKRGEKNTHTHSKINKNFLLFRIRRDHVINDSKLESPLYFPAPPPLLPSFLPFLVFSVYFNFFFFLPSPFSSLCVCVQLILFADSVKREKVVPMC